jgi:hypothetical protein
VRGALAEQVQALAREMERPRLLHIHAVLQVHDRRVSAGTCPCCASPFAEIVETIEVADLIIDLATGERILRSRQRPDVWRALRATAATEEIELRCSVHQAPLVLDETPRHLFASGGNRSSKTTAGFVWLAIQWLKRGGREKRFWLCASTGLAAHKNLMKIFRGTGQSPRVLPPTLTAYMPATHRSGNQATRMIDGSIIDLKSYDGDPDGERLKSDAIVAALVDEAAHLSNVEPLNVLRGRCMDEPAGGRLFLATTATPDSFLREEVVQPALAFERLAAGDADKTDKHPGSRWLFAKFPLLGNPWINKANIERELATLDPHDPSVLRNYYGEWVTSTGPLWTMFDPERHIVAHEARDFDELGMLYRIGAGAANHRDITSECVSLVFGQLSPHYKGVRAANRRYILGTDVNCHPMSSCVLSITAPEHDPKNRDLWHFWVWDVVRTQQGNSFAHVEELASAFFGRVMSPGARQSPLAGAGVIIDAQALGRDPTAHRFGGDPTGIAQLFGRRGFDARAPRYISVEKRGRVPVPPARMDSYMLTQRIIREGRLHISNRSAPLNESLVEQQDAGNGWEPVKNDRLSSPIDGLRYALWALVHADAPVTFGGQR